MRKNEIAAGAAFCELSKVGMAGNDFMVGDSGWQTLVVPIFGLGNG